MTLFKSYQRVETVDRRRLDAHLRAIIDILQLRRDDTFTVNAIRQNFTSQTNNKISHMRDAIIQGDQMLGREICQTIVLYTECKSNSFYWISRGIDAGLWYEVTPTLENETR